MASKADYLKKYLSKDEDDTSKKKKKRIKKHRNLAIHDDDVDWKSITPRQHDVGSDAELDPEDAPLIFGEIKDETVKKWKKWQPMASEKDDDLSPQRRDLDQSPPRRRRRHDSDDLSPPRHATSPDLPRPSRYRQTDDLSPPRKSHKSHQGPADLSPPRKGNGNRRKRSPDRSPRRGLQRREYSTLRGRQKSPEILQRGSRIDIRHTSQRAEVPSSDHSPSRKRQKHTLQSEENSPPRRLRHDSPNLSTTDTHHRHDSIDSDASPTRRQRHDSNSPPRTLRHDSQTTSPPLQTLRNDTMDDIRPPRRKRHSDDFSPPRRKPQSRAESGRGSSPEGGVARMSSGVRAGLQDVDLLKRENALAREKQEKYFKGLDPAVSGRHAETVYRDKQGRRVDPKEEEAHKVAETEARRDVDEQFMQWGRGVAQIQAAQDKLADELYEMSKPLARYADDEDLEKMLKEREREGDPMLAFIKKNKAQPAKNSPQEKPKKTRPTYKRKFPANRFAIRPGYRWDGVDRSNGFEKALFARESNRKAVSDEAYKWSVEEM